MMNFVYISPNFPTYGWKFCRHLKENGVNVLGIGDSPYNALQPELQEALAEYYYVEDMQDYDAVYRAVACLIHHHGKIDKIQSNNEFWLVTEAKLRNDFNIEGVKFPEILDHKQKSKMKSYFKTAKVPFTDYCLPNNFADGKAFTDKNGFPVVVKPDDGVGACDTFTLRTESEMADFFAQKPEVVPYIMESFVDGHVETFDGMTDKKGNIVFCASQVYHQSLMDTVVNDDCIMYHSEKEMASDILKAGSAIVKAYGIKDTFFHFEFFRVTDGKTGKSKILALEVNMRPPGGMITEIYQASHDVNIYKVWADTIVKGKPEGDMTQKRYAAFASRKFRFNYVYTHEAILAKFGQNVMLHTQIEGVTARAMGDYIYLIFADTMQEIDEMIEIVNQRV